MCMKIPLVSYRGEEAPEGGSLSKGSFSLCLEMSKVVSHGGGGRGGTM